MIEIRGLTKRYGPTTAVDDLSFRVEPGRVTGFLGPNGSGKSTTMRVALGLDRATAGEALLDGTPYRDLRYPLRTVGALLDARWVHPNRSARAHLRWIAASNALPAGRVDTVLEQVGLTAVADRRAGAFSLGMSQRLGIAAALLGDPGTLLFDEPVNGLDPEGVRWIRRLVQGLAAEGRTVLVSSHLLSEMAVAASHLVVIGRGRLIAESTTAEFIDSAADDTVLVRTPQPVLLAEALRRAGASIVPVDGDDLGLSVTGATPEKIGEVAAARGLVLHGLTPQHASLENAFLRLTGHDVEYVSGGPDQAAAVPAAGR
ncbi:ATP-binding cassette domain-containing protein [Pseudonocardia lacus]|uniref:ATP-binding cassette domain-containing protein n=1 Tax=Pseudonocardia lacus TaxID=2835865 RepID=UPI001BDBC83E|nr:ATP-binding cassette domain-containing protein [Pseudonocardia lacus]